MSDTWPAVTCLCPTYGRFRRLRESLACFLAQDYPGQKHLLILNDAPERLRVRGANGLPIAGVSVTNDDPRYAWCNLGDKRQWLLERAETPLVAHWDDDDLYLPHHLTRGVEALSGCEIDYGCSKSRGAHYLIGPRDSLQYRGVHHNVFEGSMLFRREEALALGGYPAIHSGQAKALMGAFEQACRGQCRLRKIGDQEWGGVSYVYRWHDGVGHISGIGNKPDALKRFQAQNRDFGRGEPLTPADLTPYWEALSNAA